MNPMTIDEFVEALSEVSDLIRESKEQEVDYWSPDSVPPTVLFSSFGKAVARRFQQLDSRVKSRMFQLIEAGMTSVNPELVSVVASGFIEALVSESAKVDGLWEEIKGFLGASSLQHAKAWLGDV